MSVAEHLPMSEGREFDAIRAMLAAWGPRARGIGDDAAMLDIPVGERLVVSTDASVDGVHFRREWLTPEEIGARAAAAALSDLAAMGALPAGLLLALAIPPDWWDSMVALSSGVGQVAECAGCPIIGGNVSRASELSLTITVLGSARRPLERRGARVGDALYVTGCLGGPSAALRAWTDGQIPTPQQRERFAAPVPRLLEGRWLADAGCHAAIDISDGLVADAGHLARASGVRLHLDLAALPRVPGASRQDVASGGEEYELLVAFPDDGSLDPARFEQRFGLPITRVGTARAGDGIEVRDTSRVDQPRGHDHLS